MSNQHNVQNPIKKDFMPLIPFNVEHYSAIPTLIQYPFLVFKVPHGIKLHIRGSIVHTTNSPFLVVNKLLLEKLSDIIGLSTKLGISVVVTLSCAVLTAEALEELLYIEDGIMSSCLTVTLQDSIVEHVATKLPAAARSMMLEVMFWRVLKNNPLYDFESPIEVSSDKEFEDVLSLISFSTKYNHILVQDKRTCYYENTSIEVLRYNCRTTFTGKIKEIGDMKFDDLPFDNGIPDKLATVIIASIVDSFGKTIELPIKINNLTIAQRKTLAEMKDWSLGREILIEGYIDPKCKVPINRNFIMFK